MEQTPNIRRHVLFVALCQATRLAARLGVSLKDLEELTAAAYFHELRRASKTQQQAAEQMGTSLRKAASLAATLRETFYEVDEAVSIPRRIEYLLWAAPASRARLSQFLPGYDESQLQRAIEKLIKEGRVRENPSSRTPVLSVTRGNARLVKNDWISRLDGVENFMRSVGNVLVQRFYGDSDTSMARTVSLRMSRSKIAELVALYEETIWPALTRLERESAASDDIVELDVSLFWAASDQEKEESS